MKVCVLLKVCWGYAIPFWDFKNMLWNPKVL